MSNFIIKAIERSTGNEVEVHALDNYFNRRVYGYSVGGKVLTEKKFSKRFQPVEL